jgi:hypothetical protein
MEQSARNKKVSIALHQSNADPGLTNSLSPANSTERLNQIVWDKKQISKNN